jgi:hypothetical protein
MAGHFYYLTKAGTTALPCVCVNHPTAGVVTPAAGGSTEPSFHCPVCGASLDPPAFYTGTESGPWKNGKVGYFYGFPIEKL